MFSPELNTSQLRINKQVPTSPPTSISQISPYSPPPTSSTLASSSLQYQLSTNDLSLRDRSGSYITTQSLRRLVAFLIFDPQRQPSILNHECQSKSSIPHICLTCQTVFPTLGFLGLHCVLNLSPTYPQSILLYSMWSLLPRSHKLGTGIAFLLFHRLYRY